MWVYELFAMFAMANSPTNTEEMIQKTRAIVLSSLKYSDNSLIVKLYSEKFGVIPVMIRYGSSKKSRLKANIFQPLFLLMLDMDYKPNKNIQHCKEISLDLIIDEIPYDTVKMSIAMFLSEMLSSLLQEEEANTDLFIFLHNSIQLLDSIQTGTANFHLVFLYKLSKYLGIYPIDNYSENLCCFDLSKGCYSTPQNNSKFIVDNEISKYLHTIANCDFADLENIKINGKLRSKILDALILYYKYHFHEVTAIKSLDILKQVFY